MQLNKKAQDSVAKRYSVSLFSNGIIFLISLATAGIVPRALGPKQLGDYGLLSRISAAFREIFNLNTSSALFTLASKEEKSGPLVKAYSIWFVAQLLLILSIIICALWMGLGKLIWPDQKFEYIILVAVLDWMFFLGVTLKAISDTKAFTARAQIVNLIVSLINIFLLVIFALTGWLNLGIYIAIQMFTSALLSLFIVTNIILPHKDIFWQGQIKDRLKELRDYFYKYCSPLVVYSLAGFVFEYFDRIILQRFSGSIEQGFFHLASTWTACCVIFTTSIMPIYKRELAYSLFNKTKEHAAGMFTKYLKMMFFITTVIAMYIAFHARNLLNLLAGPKYDSAVSILMLMCFYPIWGVCGQLNGATFFSSERPAVLRNLGIASLLWGIPITYFLIALPTARLPGLGLGAFGLALKTVLINLITVQVFLRWNCKFFNLRMFHFCRHQVYSLVLITGTMIIVIWFTSIFIYGPGVFDIILKLALDALIYFGVLGVLIYFRPQIAGITKQDLLGFLQKLRSYIFIKNNILTANG